MCPGKGHGIQLAAIHRHHNRTGFLCFGGKPLQGAIRFSGGNENLVHRAPAFQRLLQGVSALQLTLGLLNGSGGSDPLRAAILFVHIGILRFLGKLNYNTVPLYQIFF